MRDGLTRGRRFETCGIRGIKGYRLVRCPAPETALNVTSIEERVLYDNYYIENWSLWLDIKVIILALFRSVISAPEWGKLC